MAKKCPVTGKRKWHDKLELLVRYSTRPGKTRAYLCPHCGFWHATGRDDGETPKKRDST